MSRLIIWMSFLHFDSIQPGTNERKPQLFTATQRLTAAAAANTSLCDKKTYVPTNSYGNMARKK
jgi:hypothetical protein